MEHGNFKDFVVVIGAESDGYSQREKTLSGCFHHKPWRGGKESCSKLSHGMIFFFFFFFFVSRFPLWFLSFNSTTVKGTILAYMFLLSIRNFLNFLCICIRWIVFLARDFWNSMLNSVSLVFHIRLCSLLRFHFKLICSTQCWDVSRLNLRVIMILVQLIRFRGSRI